VAAGLAVAVATPSAATPLAPDRVLDIVRRVESISGDVSTVETPEKVELTLAADVLFAFDSADLTADAAARIAEAAARITQNGTGPVSVVGHTDSVGSDAYNQDLSARRAAAVAAGLGAIARADYQVAGRGESEPVAGNDTDQGRQQNRRVTVSFARKG
jgi:OmpA-OmpF porin, OOP family